MMIKDRGTQSLVSNARFFYFIFHFFYFRLFRLVSDLYELFVAEISWLRSKQRSLDGKRREALNKILDIKGDN